MKMLVAKIDSLAREDHSRLDLHVHAVCSQGQLTCFEGANGAGKSTLIQAMIGIIPHLRSTIRVDGEILYDGHQLDRVEFFKLAGKMAYLPERSWAGVVCRTVGEERRLVAASGLRYMDPSRMYRLLDLSDETELRTLSFGQLQRVRLMRVLEGNSSLVALDEPTQGLDAASKSIFMQQVLDVSRETIVLTATQDSELISIAHNRLVVGSPRTQARRPFITPIAQLEFFNLPILSRSFELSWTQLIIGYKGGFRRVIGSNSVRSGEVVHLRGANGSGKSTFQRTLAGLLVRVSGAVVFGVTEGKPGDGAFEYLQPDPSRCFVFESVAEEFNHTYPTQPCFSIWARQVLTAFCGVDIWPLKPTVLSAGQQRMVSLLLRSPNSDIFLLDEPTTGLDDEALIGLTRYLQMLLHLGKAVIIASHDVAALPSLQMRTIDV